MASSSFGRTRAAKAAPATLARLRELHPDAHCELDHQSAFQLLVATVLSAQTTDVAVNKVTPGLFATYPDAASLAKAKPEDVQRLIDRIGMFRQKAKNIVGLAGQLVAKHKGQVPASLPALIELPGVGRKTANVVLGVIFGTPEGVVVDTHVQRISQRLGWTEETDAVKIELALCKLLPKDTWNITSHTLIFHGRRVCFAQRPNCEGCGVRELCPSADKAEHVGRKAPRTRMPTAKTKASAQNGDALATKPKKAAKKRA
jgi:endonuclease III